MSNHLVGLNSPYLKLHAKNPIDWYPWCEEAFEKAKKENKPVFLSIGYASCHWCHVMARESFEDQAVADYLNEHFVSIKLDREERPDIDEIYMIAVQAGSGQGGWPATLFLTPDKKPFFAGTYFPKKDLPHRPSFSNVLQHALSNWKNNLQEVLLVADRFSKVIEETLLFQLKIESKEINLDLIENAVVSLRGNYDRVQGGFGIYPKFPPHSALRFLISYYHSPLSNNSLRKHVKEMVIHTLTKIALGGIHDQIGGGFHRYATDAKWLYPHFEKMLYDNALLLQAFTRAQSLTSNDYLTLRLFKDAANGIIYWLKDHMISKEGVFYSSINAESKGKEGDYYLWSYTTLNSVLKRDAAEFCKTFNASECGNFFDESVEAENKKNILFLQNIPENLYLRERKKLKAYQKKGILPEIDKKAIAAWNGMMITSLALNGEIQIAKRCADAWIQAEEKAGYFPHQIMDGVPEIKAFLDDYSYFIEAFHVLSKFSGDSKYKNKARQMTQKMLTLFFDIDKEGFYYSGILHKTPLGRSKSIFDTSIPNANASALKNLLELGDHEKVRRALTVSKGALEKAPEACISFLELALKFLEKNLLTVAAVPAELARNSEGWSYTEIELSIPEGMHLNSHEPEDELALPTVIEIESASSPAEYQINYSNVPKKPYEGTLRIPISIRYPGEGVLYTIKISYQICTTVACLAPEKKVLDIKFI